MSAAYIAGGALMFGGFLLMVWGIGLKKKLAEARLWPQVKAHLGRLETIGKGPKVIGTDDYRSYMLRVEYSYEVNGMHYVGTRAVLGAEITVQKEMEEFCSQFQEGQEIHVFYNPDDHKDSVMLVERPGGKEAREYWGGVFLIVLGFIVLVANSGFIGN